MYNRPFALSFDRKGKNFIGITRHYTKINNAVTRAVSLLLEYGRPGDVAEIFSRNFGYQIATVKIHVGGRFTITIAGE